MSKEIEEQNKNVKIHVWNSRTFWATKKEEIHASDFINKIKKFFNKIKLDITK